MVRISSCAAVRQPCIAHHTRKRRRHAKNDAPLPQAACWAACAAYEEGVADNALEYACRAVNGSIRHEVTRLYLYVAYRPGSDTSGYGRRPCELQSHAGSIVAVKRQANGACTRAGQQCVNLAVDTGKNATEYRKRRSKISGANN